MAITEPGTEEVESAIAELLREQEIGSLAVLGPDGEPMVSMMHFASDGLSVYLHTFTYSRKHEAITRDPRVSYTIAAMPPDGFYGRGQLRAVQVEGNATFVTDPAEIARAVEVSREQFDWLKDVSMFDTFAKGTAHHQAFFRIDPVEAVWNDNRVRLLWRRIVTFSSDGKHVAALAPYETKLQPTSVQDANVVVPQ
ncbi:pyridoxamine 5'-phosphate oxidase family protein [Mycolicibacterium sp. lyk4-40-TYG-92]|uniref:pyridoxamine 5'-phosphate oxidase family protein n=1 Tax=Mycolicibacterium sp. lyk4-40-TYG-92 TaxID=3040295 RepID=UPI00254E3254|nr:pyridoxamine 5'-phosphate oxidase family protein [Mycolicibacterium sp. lyk4-40-TYG-92]